METEKRLIEEWLPLSELNENARREMGFIRIPKISNLHSWMARRPTCTSRILTLASILPREEEVRKKFTELVGLDKADKQPYKVVYLVNPDRNALRKVIAIKVGIEPKEITVVDPMAGGGAIPLEALRLGLKTVAMDYNPVAYVILKATLEYPAKYGEKLYDDVKREAEAIIEYAKSEFGKYYPENVENYIFARGFTCPKCDRLVPIIHDVRLGKEGPYINFNFNENKKIFETEIVENKTEFDKLKCPYKDCLRPFTREEVFHQWGAKHRQLLKYALEGDEAKAKEKANELLRVHIPLVKQIPRKKGRGKDIVPCDRGDIETLKIAYIDLASHINELKSYIPNTLIPDGNEVFEGVRKYGLRYWYQLFNPRQLLILAKLIAYVHKRGLRLIEERKEYGVAIATYLAIGVSKITNFNNLTTTWDSSTKTIRELVDHYARTRKVGLGLEYCEAKRMDLALGWAYEPDVEKPTATGGGICPLLKQLCNWLDGLGDMIRVYMGDARELSKIVGEGNMDLVNVDPPYFNQHFYSDLSEFFWQVLMLTLKPAIDAGFLFNRDKSCGRVECLVSGWSPSLPMVPRAGEIIVRRVKGKADIVEVSFTKEWWREQMWKFFIEAYKALKDNGMLIVWYTHSDPKAWEAVLSGLYASKFMVSKVWTVRTEMAQRRVALAGSAFFTSLSLTAKKTGESIIVGERSPKELFFNEQVKEAITSSVIDALKSARVSGASDREAYIMALAGAIAGATRIRNPALESIELLASETLNRYIGEARESEIARRLFKRTSDFFRESLYPVALFLGASKVLEEELIKAGLSEEEIKLIVGADDITKAYLVFWLSMRRVPFVDYDFVEKICKVVGTTVSTLETLGLIKKIKKNVYLVPFGQEMFDAIRGRLEYLDRTAAGGAMYLIKLIVDSPIKDDEERCARDVLSVKPVSKQVIATATFLLKTARDEELRKASISQYTKPFIERVLKALYAR